MRNAQIRYSEAGEDFFLLLDNGVNCREGEGRKEKCEKSRNCRFNLDERDHVPLKRVGCVHDVPEIEPPTRVF